MALTVLNSLLEAFPSRVTGAKQVSLLGYHCASSAQHIFEEAEADKQKYVTSNKHVKANFKSCVGVCEIMCIYAK